MRARVTVNLADPREAKIAREAMSVDNKPGSRSSMTITADGSILRLDITASDLGALRASLNSSLRSIKIVDSML